MKRMTQESYGSATATTPQGTMRTAVEVSDTDGRNPFTVIADAATIAEDGESRDGEAPSPTKLLLASLASCKAMTARVYADRKGWDLRSVSVRVDHVIETTDGSPLHAMEARVSLEGDLTEDQRRRIVAITEKCHVQQLITGRSEVRTSEADTARAS